MRTDNTEAVEAYIQRIEEICRIEHFDVVYPSLDPEVYLFAKKQRALGKIERVGGGSRRACRGRADG